MYDISLTLGPEVPTYPGDRPFTRKETRSLDEGDSLTLSELRLSAHAGTHVDAPSHMVAGGQPVNQLPVDGFSGPARVLPLRDVGEAVAGADLTPYDLQPGEIALLRTQNSDRIGEDGFFEDYVYLSEDGARALVDRRARAVGIDALSIEGYGVEGYPTHRTLMEAGVGIIEGLDLSRVDPGVYYLFCFPLKVADGDGGPARAVLFDEASLPA